MATLVSHITALSQINIITSDMQNMVWGEPELVCRMEWEWELNVRICACG